MQPANKNNRRGFTLAFPIILGLAVGFALESWAIGVGVAVAFTAAWASGTRKERDQ